MPTTPATSSVAKDSPLAPPRVAPIPCPILGNTKVKTKTSRNGWRTVRGMNSFKFLRSTVMSRSNKAMNAVRLAWAALRVARSPRAGAASPGVVVAMVISRAGPFR